MTSRTTRRRFIKGAGGLLLPACVASKAHAGFILQSGAQAVAASSGSVTAPGFSAPIMDGQPVTISALSGENFGIGPVTVLFDPLNNGTSGATISTSNPLVGTYDSVGGAFFSNAVSTRSGTVALCSYSGASPGMRQLRTHWDPALTVAIRYWWYIPVGSSIPDAVSPGAYSSNASSYKLFWLGIAGNMQGGTDICIPTFAGGSSCTMSGNGNTTSAGDGCAWNYPGNIVDNFRYGYWTMVEALQDSVTPRVCVNHCSGAIGMSRYIKPNAANYWGNSSVQYWSHGNLPGYVRTGGYPDCNIFHQDFCIKTGAGAWADVFFGNGATIDSCSDLRHVQIDSWTNSAIECTPRGLGSVDLTGWNVFIRLADNTFLPPRAIS